MFTLLATLVAVVRRADYHWDESPRGVDDRRL